MAAHICYKQYYTNCNECRYYINDPYEDYRYEKVCVAKDKQSVEEYVDDYRKYLKHCQERGITPNRSSTLDCLLISFNLQKEEK